MSGDIRLMPDRGADQFFAFGLIEKQYNPIESRRYIDYSCGNAAHGTHSIWWPLIRPYRKSMSCFAT